MMSFEISTQAGCLGSDPMAFWRVHSVAGKWRVVPSPTFAAAVRSSTYRDARVLAAAKVGEGTTRHFPATEWTLQNAMGSEPKLPAWVEISNDIVPTELGQLLSGAQASPAQCMATIKERVDRLVAPLRKR